MTKGIHFKNVQGLEQYVVSCFRVMYALHGQMQFNLVLKSSRMHLDVSYWIFFYFLFHDSLLIIILITMNTFLWQGLKFVCKEIYLADISYVLLPLNAGVVLFT